MILRYQSFCIFKFVNSLSLHANALAFCRFWQENG